MPRSLFVCMLLLATARFVGAQISSPSTDVLGAHLNYGRGCTACHAPHSGAYGNGNAKSADARAGNSILWGEDVTGLYGKTIATGGGKFVEVLPTTMSAGSPDVNGLLTCLSCHDGNYAQSAMMKNQVYETLPPTYGTSNKIPTLLGAGEAGASGYLNDHPVGLSAKVSCGGKNWDCTEVNGVISMNGTNSKRFVKNYGLFVQLSAYNGSAVVTCISCHDQHVMNVVTVSSNSNSGLPAGHYATMFFLRGPYNANDSNPLTNQTAQFCRQCHGDLSNEANGSTAGTVF